MTEEWKEIQGYEGIYEVSTFGRVRSRKDWFTFVLKTSGHRGYRKINLVKDGKGKSFPVHRLVATAFLPNEENKPQVNHIDGRKDNNCVNNLEWMTSSENIQHAFANGLMSRPSGEKSHRAKLSDKDVEEIRSSSLPQKEIAKLYGVSPAQICRIKKGLSRNK